MISSPQSVEQLFHAARECSPTDRAHFLNHACRDLPELRQKVEERLLAEGYNVGSPTDSAGSDAAPGSGSDLAASDGMGAAADGKNAGRFSPGEVIAKRFTVVRYIARGGMGEVYEVEDRFLQGVHVALKMILPEIANDAGSSHRFEQEVLLARKVTHPNLCPIYDIARSDDPPPPFLFLTMKLLAGETLSSRMRRPGLIPRDHAIAIFQQMVAGVAAIHAAGVIHRDIKPNNVMLEYSGPQLCLSIMDFGLARLHEPEVTMATRSLAAGTPGYMAPEILKGEGPSQATDLFALGVLLHQVLTGERPSFGALSLSVQPSPALNTADVPSFFVHAVKEFLSSEPEHRCAAFERIQSALASTHPAAAWATNKLTGSARSKLLSRRQFAVGSGLAACAVAGGIGWKWDRLTDLLHPLPGKRFVALVGWPPAADAHIEPMIASVVDAIGSELARAEAFDHDFLIIPHSIDKAATSFAQLNELRESLGANLVLAASGVAHSSGLHLLLRVLDPATTRTLRERAVNVPINEQLQAPEKAVRTAAELLNISRYKPDARRIKAGTSNPEAYAAFQSAESLMKQDNDAGLDAAIEKYKQAIEIDPRYAVAQAKLSWAYLRSYGLHGDAAALMLAGANSRSAIQLDPSLVDAHLGLASFYQQTGDSKGASHEMSKALSLDPSNPHTLIHQANFYAADNRWEESEDTFARVLQMRPNYWLAHQELGVILDQQGKYREALIQFRAASLASPKNALALGNVGAVHLQLGEVPEAIENLNTSFERKPADTTAIELAAAFRLEQKYPESIDYAQRAVKLNPNEPYDWLELGDCYAAAGRSHADAVAAYRQAVDTQAEELQTSPKDGPGWMLLALCQAKAGQPEKAMATLARAESLKADDMDSQITKVRILELLGKREEALSTISRCLSRGPTQFQFDSMPDLEELRASPGYKSIVASAASANQLSI
jgi:serine/threonine protein kinase/Tfp pilus assembly protein PilF